MQDKIPNHAPIPTELNIAPRGKSWLHGQLIDGEHGYPTRQSMENSERAAFEKWASFFGTWDVERDDDPSFSTTGYTDITVNVAWLAWQARAALAATPAAAVPVVLPEPDAAVSELMRLVESYADAVASDMELQYEALEISIKSKLHALLAGVSAPAAAHHDDAAAVALAALMKAKLAKQRAKGYGGWDTEECTQQRLSDMLRRHVDKGDPVDVANFCAFLSARGEGIAPQAQADARDAQLLAFAVSEIRRDEMEHEPVLYVSKGQLGNFRDPDGPDSTAHGRYLPARVTPAGKFTTPLFAAPQAQAADFQQRVQPWMMACFGPEISADRIERNHRFLEESLELVQSLGCTASEAHQLVDYVFGRPVGEPVQEAGGVMVTLAALCLANGLDMHACGETELARIWTKVEAIRAKQAAKPKHSPLPMHAPEAQADARDASNEWEEITTMPTCDDLIWLYCQDTHTVDGPVAPHPSYEDSWTHWAYANAPSTAAIAAQAAQQGGE